MVNEKTITREQYEDMERRLFDAVAARVEAQALAREYMDKYFDSRRELKETKNHYEEMTRGIESLETAKAVGQSFADKCAQQAEEIERLNALLEAYRKVVDLTGISKDDIVLALARCQ